MRKLFVMLGAPASGKDHFINKYDLQDYVLSADQFRQLTGATHYTALKNSNNDEYLEPVLDRENNKFVWKNLYNFLEKRMDTGATIVLNNTGLSSGYFQRVHFLAKKYNYDLHTIDCMAQYFDGDFSTKKRSEVVKELQKQNINRKYSVPISVISDYTSRYVKLIKKVNADENGHYKWMHLIDASDNNSVKRIFAIMKPLDFNKYKKIQIIGDIHADYDALLKVFAEHEAGTAYVFLGDYLDRGTETIKTFNFITDDLRGTNLYFITGNHENAWEKYAQNEIKSGQFASLSLPKLLDYFGKYELKKRLSRFIANTYDYLVFTYHGKIYYCSHAGLEPDFVKAGDRFELLNRHDIIWGIGNNYENTNPYGRDIDSIWNNDSEINDNQINVHGHRNNFDQFICSNSINLNIEDKFRWMTLYPDKKAEYHSIDRIDIPDFVDRMKFDHYISKSKTGLGITAYNITRKGFQQQAWTKQTMRARGMFVDDDTHKIVGRGFKKFFEVNTKPEADINRLEYPIKIYRKHDGFLAIAMYYKKINQILVFSKGGNTDYADLAKSDLIKTGYYDRIKEYFANKDLRDTSLLFEIVDPANDTHIVKYNQLHTCPIAIISNDLKGSVLNTDISDNNPYRKHSEFRGMQKNIEQGLLGTVNNKESLLKFIKQDQKLNPTKEGIVIYGPNLMLKVKSPFYHAAKELRISLDLYNTKHRIKKHWSYPYSKAWFDYCIKNGKLQFSPDLVLNLRKRSMNHEI